MEILNEKQHRALAFVGAVNRGGHQPSESQLLEWVDSPSPKPGRRGRMISPGRPAEPLVGSLFASQLDSIVSRSTEAARLRMQDLVSGLSSATFSAALGRQPAIPAEYAPDTPAETFVAHLLRLEWLTRSEPGGLQLTPLGRALLRTTDLDEDVDSAESVVLGSHNELAYPTLVSRLVEAGEGLIVDPYLRAADLLTIRTHTSISRVLVSDSLKQSDLAGIAVLVENNVGSSSFEVRSAEKKVLHDRYIVGSDFIDTIGTSLNTVGKTHMTILTPLPAAAADTVRSTIESWWQDARVVAKSPSHQPQPPAGDAPDE